MKPFIIIFINLNCFIIPFVFGMTDNHPIGGRSAGMGNASMTLGDLWSVHNNQAALAIIENPAAGIYYENRFLLNELSLKSAAFVLPTNPGTFGFSFTSFGYSNYNEMKAGLAYGKKLGRIFSFGVQLDYLRTHIAEEYGNKDAFTFEAGIRTELNRQLSVGVHVFNPIRVKIQPETNDRIPAVFKLGLAYQLSDKILLAVETEKNSDYKPLIRGGFEYKIVTQAAVRFGYSTLPAVTGSEDFSMASVFSIGFGLNLSRFDLDLASSYHQTLGWSPMVSLIYHFR